MEKGSLPLATGRRRRGEGGREGGDFVTGLLCRGDESVGRTGIGDGEALGGSLRVEGVDRNGYLLEVYLRQGGLLVLGSLDCLFVYYYANRRVTCGGKDEGVVG